jgi:Rhodopirellula transposase DDE domain
MTYRDNRPKLRIAVPDSISYYIEIYRLKICAPTVASLLHDLGYSLQANTKTLEGPSHPDRDQQFRYINAYVKRYLKSQRPVISVDTKKKALVGPYKNGGQTWRPKGDPQLVNVHDVPDTELGKAVPYGV